MQKRFRSFAICLKLNMLRPGMWIFCICMLFFLWLVHVIAVPKAASPIAGLVCKESKTATEISDLLTTDFSENISFRLYEDADLLREDVETGKVICGFVFSDDFENAFWNGKLKKSVTCIETPFSNGTEVFKEAFYTALFREYSIRIIKEAQSEIFADANEERTDSILQANESYLSGDRLFTPKEIFVDTKVQEETTVQDGVHADIRGLFYLILFLLMLGISGSLSRGGRVGLLGALCPVDAAFFRIASMVAGVLVPMVAGAIFLNAIGCALPAFSEGLHLLLFLVYSCIWIEFLGRHVVLRECGTKLVSLTALHLLALPVFIDLTSVFPPIRLLRYLLPTAVYLL